MRSDLVCFQGGRGGETPSISSSGPSHLLHFTHFLDANRTVIILQYSINTQWLRESSLAIMFDVPLPLLLDVWTTANQMDFTPVLLGPLLTTNTVAKGVFPPRYTALPETVWSPSGEPTSPTHSKNLWALSFLWSLSEQAQKASSSTTSQVAATEWSQVSCQGIHINSLTKIIIDCRWLGSFYMPTAKCCKFAFKIALMPGWM